MTQPKEFGWPDSPDSRLFFNYLTLAHEYLSKTFVSYFKGRYGLTPNQMSALCYLKPSGGLTMTALAKKLNISKQQATQLVESLAKKQLVERRSSELSRRTVMVDATAQGIAVIAEGERAYVDHALGQLGSLSGEERASMLEAMELLARLLPRLNFSPDSGQV